MCIRALFRKCRKISTVRAHFSGLKKCAESAAFRQICAFVQKYEKVQNSCGVNLLIYNCKRRFRTNVLFFLLYYTQEKNNYKILFHVEHKKLKFNNLPKQSRVKKSAAAPAPPYSAGIAVVRPYRRTAAPCPILFPRGARGRAAKRPEGCAQVLPKKFAQMLDNS